MSGPVRFYHGRQMAPREFIILGDADDAESAPEGGVILPVYPATEGLSHKHIRALIDRHLDALIPLSPDVLPPALRAALGLPTLPEALRAVHRPASAAEAELGRRRLAFDELFDLQLMLARARALAKRDKRSGIAFEVRARPHPAPPGVAALAAHRRPEAGPARDHRRHDGAGADAPAAHGRRRHRQDRRGAVRHAAGASRTSYQAALMAPTELLAEQHATTLARLLAPLGIMPEVLLGRMTGGRQGGVAQAASRRAQRARHRGHPRADAGDASRSGASGWW